MHKVASVNWFYIQRFLLQQFEIEIEGVGPSRLARKCVVFSNISELTNRLVKISLIFILIVLSLTTGTLSNLSKQNNGINYNYGVAEFDLSELLNGERILYHASPIRACKESQNVLHEISSKFYYIHYTFTT